MEPIHIPTTWHDDALIPFETFCDLIQTPQRTVRDWRQREVGPRFWRLEGTGRLYITVAEVRRLLRPPTGQPGEMKDHG